MTTSLQSLLFYFLLIYKEETPSFSLEANYKVISYSTITPPPISSFFSVVEFIFLP